MGAWTRHPRARYHGRRRCPGAISHICRGARRKRYRGASPGLTQGLEAGIDRPALWLSRCGDRLLRRGRGPLPPPPPSKPLPSRPCLRLLPGLPDLRINLYLRVPSFSSPLLRLSPSPASLSFTGVVPILLGPDRTSDSGPPPRVLVHGAWCAVGTLTICSSQSGEPWVQRALKFLEKS